MTVTAETATRKITRPEACAGLARRMGWRIQPDALSWFDVLRPDGSIAASGYVKDPKWPGEDALFQSQIPNFFSSCDAAAELISFLYPKTQELGHLSHNLWMDFLNSLLIDSVEEPHAFAWDSFQIGRAMLATPEQITLAACAALGIKVE